MKQKFHSSVKMERAFFFWRAGFAWTFARRIAPGQAFLGAPNIGQR
jgi:hypothetical protein